LFSGGPFISDIALSRQAQQFKLALEQMGVLAKRADTLSVESFGRFCISTFKEVQKGGKVTSIKSAIGPELRALTDAQVFRFPSTFTFIFRAFASVDGIGKGLDNDFDIGRLAKPFIEAFTDEVKYGSPWTKGVKMASEATGLNFGDINTAVSSPRKIAYLEETMRSMEQGTLKIRVRSLEIERSLERSSLMQAYAANLLLGSIFLQLGLSSALGRGLVLGYQVPRLLCVVGAAASGLRALSAHVKVKALDKKVAKYESKEFD
jgi:predicted unusual protein kinase regulating ubiquinone biosynthesis (AarF/ABC1/UbiB family)